MVLAANSPEAIVLISIFLTAYISVTARNNTDRANNVFLIYLSVSMITAKLQNLNY